MDNKKLSEDLKALSKNKGFFNALIFLLIILFLWLVLSSLGNSKNSKNNISTSGATEVTNSEEENVNNDFEEYEKEQKAELEKILSNIDGVGEVTVMIRFESGDVKVPAVNNSTQVSKTVEDDGNGGSRTTTQENQGDTVVTSSSGSKTEPFITKVYKPQVTGVIITAEGASSSKVKYDIQVAVSKLYDIGIDKVNVYPAKK